MERIKISLLYLLISFQHVSVLGPIIRETIISWWEEIVEFDVHVTVHRDIFLILKPSRLSNFSSLFWNETLHVSDSSFAHHQEFFTVHTAMVYVIQFC
jgi:hypothetical protein